MPLERFLPFVRRWFEETYGEPTCPQREGWAAIADGHHTLIVAPTGSGKTLAAFLWTLDHLHRLALERRLEDRVYVIYVSPLRALNNDIEKNLRQPLAGIRAGAEAGGHALPEVRVAVRTGDTLAPARRAMTRRPPHVLITTPESLYILLTSEKFRPALAGTRFVIVDEVHALLSNKRGAHLALSLERLAALAGDGIQRIGCSATVRPVEEALRFLVGAGRRGAIVDAGFSREMELEVVTPVVDFLTAQSDTVWDALIQQLAEWVAAHRTTLVFTPSRRSAERLARNLNERLPDGGVMAHHGSLSRRARLEAEDRLKRGDLRALVATSSLELGIDVGAIDLVVQVQSPRNIAAALQRVGRAGHLLTRVSKGKIIATKGDELVEAAAVVRAIRERQLDRQAMPEAPLDVLAQQIVACVATEPWEVDALHALVRRAAPYASLAMEEFLAVVRSLADPLPAEVKGVAPRVLWDRVNNRLHPRRGSRLLALTSGGTIPDSGLYDVYVADTDLKVGTLDEEFVTESLPGDVFLLGSHPWRIAKVRADRVLVEDARGMSPTVPFWKGEHPSRSYDLGVLVGRLRREAAARVGEPDFEPWAAATFGLSPMAASALRAWIAKGRELLDGVPDDQTVVVESFSDEMGGRHAMIHSVFGMRVNGAWGIVLREALRQRFGLIAETSHVDDGVLLSFAPGQVPPAPGRLPFLVPPEDVDALLGRGLIGSPLFTTRFRHAAVRALFIARMVRGQRTPAWLQRLKADALMEAVGGQAEFPVVAETLRECFNDALDVPHLKEILTRLRQGGMQARHVDTPMPSPFVYPLLLAWDWAYLDAGHAEERRSDAVVMRKAWHAPAGPLQPEVVAAVVAELQKTAPERRARDANELAGLLEELGDLTGAEVAERVTADPRALLDALAAEGRVRVIELASGRRAWISTVEAPMYAAIGALLAPGDLARFADQDSSARLDDLGPRLATGDSRSRSARTADCSSPGNAGPFGAAAPDPRALERILLRAVRTRGPVRPAELAQRYDAAEADVAGVLEVAEARGALRKLPDGAYVHVAVLDEIQRRQAHARRVVRAIASPDTFAAAVQRRQHVHPDHRLAGPPGLLAAIEPLQGEDFPLKFWEQELLPARLEGYEAGWLDQLGLSGDIVWTPFEGRAGRVGVALRDNLGWLKSPHEESNPSASRAAGHGAGAVSEPPQTKADGPSTSRAAGHGAGAVPEPAQTKAILRHLELRGASFVQEIARAVKLDSAAVLAALWELFWAGLVTPDSFQAIRRGPEPAEPRRDRRRRYRPAGLPLASGGRWSAFAPEEPIPTEEREEAWAHLLLARYGVVSRELARGDWSTLRHTLLRMEYGGEVLRGYFVEGLSGEQYALPEAVRDLEGERRRAEPHVLVNICDPANVWGGVFPLLTRAGTRAAAARLPQNWLITRAGKPVLLAESHGRDLTTLSGWEPADLGGAVRALASVIERPMAYRPVRRLDILSWDGAPIRETEAAAAFIGAGFTADGPRLSWDGYPGPARR
jgi:ATP-dependent Lhr-like helicase